MAVHEDENCDGDAVSLGNMALRIGSIFIILVASLVGAMSPILLSRQTKMHVPKLTFFVCKYVGTGVIISTAWMHLLDPAVDQLGDRCVAERWPSMGNYPWALCIGLMTVMIMFFVELLASNLGKDDEHAHGANSDSESGRMKEVVVLKIPPDNKAEVGPPQRCPHDVGGEGGASSIPGPPDDVSYPPGGEDHLAHQHEHREGDAHGGLAGQLTAIFILEFGVVFHSVFIGLTLGTTQNLVILLIVLVFHQMFEGLGLGSRLATSRWPRGKSWLPYLLAVGFALSTPIGIAAGIASKPRNAATQKLVNGIFDSISAGILMYTGLVELLAHELMFNPHMRKAPLQMQIFAFGCVAFGVAIMALLARWA